MPSDRSRTQYEPGEPPVKTGISDFDYAERVLFSESLEEKLDISLFETIAIETGKPPQQMTGTIDPGRPGYLRYSRETEFRRPGMPSSEQSLDEESRGILLHFFANHELLAAELMALALLRFPDAPFEFRKGLLDTLREEQIHTRLYLKRMKECGVTFGDFPVSRFFWDTVSSMETPLDYVSRLSLTFEQANLDYARHFAEVFRQSGDDPTAAILEKIYRDEIGHVGYGLKWFRHWKEQGQSDWDAISTRLVFPLSPSRAKGNRTVFNREGRRQAGFDEEYINRLSLFERSRGRTPDVIYFNADAEQRMAAPVGKYSPDPFTRSLVRDLDCLSLFLARNEDLALLRSHPGDSHLAKLAHAGFTLPEIEILNEKGQLDDASLLRERRIRRIRPWSHSPELPGPTEPLLENQTLPSGAETWDESKRRLFDKSSQLDRFRPWFGTSFLCQSKGEIETAFRSIREEGYSSAFAKPLLSAAGKGAKIIPLHSATFDVPTPVLIEPAYERVFDFSMQFCVEPEEFRIIGPVRQEIGTNGTYRGSSRPSKFCRGLSSSLSAFLTQTAFPVYRENSPLVEAIRHWTDTAGYRGPLSLDSFVYRDPSGALAHRILCEINPRYTMGRVLLELRKQAAPGRDVRFTIVKADDARRSTEDYSVDKDGRMVGGTIHLNPIRDDTRFVARLEVDKYSRKDT